MEGEGKVGREEGREEGRWGGRREGDGRRGEGGGEEEEGKRNRSFVHTTNRGRGSILGGA